MKRKISAVVFLVLWMCAISPHAFAAVDGWLEGSRCFPVAQDALMAWVSSIGFEEMSGNTYLSTMTPVFLLTPVVGTGVYGRAQVNRRDATGAVVQTNISVYKYFWPCDSGIGSKEDSLSIIWIALGVLVYGVGVLVGRVR